MWSRALQPDRKVQVLRRWGPFVCTLVLLIAPARRVAADVRRPEDPPKVGVDREHSDELDSRRSDMPLFLGGLSFVLLIGAVSIRRIRQRKRRPSSKKARGSVVREEEGRPPPLRVTLTPRSLAETVNVAAMRREKMRDVPKIEHDGKWHTLH